MSQRLASWRALLLAHQQTGHADVVLDDIRRMARSDLVELHDAQSRLDPLKMAMAEGARRLAEGIEQRLEQARRLGALEEAAQFAATMEDDQ